MEGEKKYHLTRQIRFKLTGALLPVLEVAKKIDVMVQEVYRNVNTAHKQNIKRNGRMVQHASFTSYADGPPSSMLKKMCL